jgi:hypothetical protein
VILADEVDVFPAYLALWSRIDPIQAFSLLQMNSDSSHAASSEEFELELGAHAPIKPASVKTGTG